MIILIQLSGKDIAQHWDVIKFAVLQNNPFLKESLKERFMRNLIVNLMARTHQCWFVLSEDTKIKSVIITRLLRDIGDIPYLLIDVVYGFEPTTDEEKQDIIEKLRPFAKKMNCSRIIVMAKDFMAINLLNKVGMTEITKVFSTEIN